MEFIANKRFQISTPNGWSDFSGIRIQEKSDLICVVTNSGAELNCTLDHRLKLDSGIFKYAFDLNVFDKIVTENGIDIIVDIIPLERKNTKDYDLTNFKKNNEYFTGGLLSHNCEFLGSSGTLISGEALKNMVFVQPESTFLNNSLHIFEQVVKDRVYVLVADVARGTGNDYSAFIVFDISEFPYKIAAKYRNNQISPIMFPDVIVQSAKYYNDAYLLIENNDAGGQVADTVLYDLEYDNLFYTVDIKGKTHLGQSNKISNGMTVGKTTNGIRTTKKNKRLGCNALKALVENNKLIIQDYDIISELSTFILVRDSYQADDGCNDDLAMCLVLFSWMSTQPFFRDITGSDLRKKLFDDKIQQMEEDMPISATSSDAIEQSEKYIVEDGVVWEIGA